MQRDLSLPVNEVFTTIQGEGVFSGVPATFIRIQGCLVGCPWCDTKHTWAVDPDAERPLAEVVAKDARESPTYAMATVDQLVALAARFGAAHVVLTGGEPCAHDLGPLSGALLGAGMAVQVETSGTYPVSVHPDAWVTVAPKVDMPGGRAMRTDALARANEIKHPVGAQRDIDRLLDLLELLPREAARPVVCLAPLSLSPRATALCVEQARRHRWRVSVQIHKLIGAR